MKKEQILKKAVLWLPAAQLIILAVLFLTARSDIPQEIDLLFSQWDSGGRLVWQDGYSIEDGQYGSSQDILHGPKLTLPAGSYTITISYQSDEYQTVRVSSGEVKRERYLNSRPFLLNPYNYEVSYDFDAKLPVEGFEVYVGYGGSGNLSLYDVTLKTNRQRYYRWIVGLLFLFLLLDWLLFCFRRKSAEKKRTILALTAMALAASLPLMIYGIHEGDDLTFHLLRIDAMASELRRGHVPVRMESLWFYGFGYPTAIMYGELLLYPFAFLRLCGFSMTAVYKCFVLCVQLGTAFLSWFSFRRIFRNRERALLLALLYMTANYRLVNVHVRAAVGEYCAMMFLPVVAAGFWGIFTCTGLNSADIGKKALTHLDASGTAQESRREGRISILLLGAGMAGVVTCHVLSTEMTCLTLVIAALLLWKRTVKPRRLLAILASAGVCLLLSAFFTVPFLDYFLHEPFEVKETYWKEWLLGMQQTSTHIAELFSFFHTPIGYRIDKVSTRMALTPGPVLMAALLIGIALILARRADTRIRVLSILSLVMLFISSDLFPWDFLAENTGFGMLLAQVEFPWRYIGCSLVPLVLLSGCLMEEYEAFASRRDELTGAVPPVSSACVTGALAVFSLLTVCIFTGSFLEHARVSYFRDTAEIDNIEPAIDAEYMLTGMHSDEVKELYSTENLTQFQPILRDGARFVVYAECGEDASIDFPLYCYSNYRATDEQGNRLVVVRSEENRRVRVLLPAGFAGQLTVDYVAPVTWTAALLLSVLTALGLMLGALWLKLHAGITKEDR